MKFKNMIFLAILALCIGLTSCKAGAGIGRKDKCPGMRM